MKLSELKGENAIITLRRKDWPEGVFVTPLYQPHADLSNPDEDNIAMIIRAEDGAYKIFDVGIEEVTADDWEVISSVTPPRLEVEDEAHTE